MKLSNGPIQYQKGWTEFFKLKFFLTTDVLIPRPETELLVEEIISRVKNEELSVQSGEHNSETLTPNSTLRIMDIGTGSGCIAISLAKNLPNAKIFAVDKSEKALEVAKKNAKYHRVENKVLFLEGDVLSGIKVMPDIIAANLPYIPTFKLMYLDPLVREFEPKIALDGGSDGFDLYRKLFQQVAHSIRPPQGWQHEVASDEKRPEIPVDFPVRRSPKFKAPRLNDTPPKWNVRTPRLIICEIDEDQGDLAKQEAKKYFPNALIEIKKDLAKKDRILVIGFGR